MKLSKVRIYSDGACRGNPGQASIGYAICDQEDKILHSNKRTIGYSKNNVAEYIAIIEAIKTALEKFSPTEVECFLDSKLVVGHFHGWKLKAAHLRPHLDKLRDLAGKFQNFKISQLPREHPMIQRVDRLANEALDNDF
jgi:ribonuclease HI